MAGAKKKKGLGGLSPEKKKLLKQLIIQKAAEDMKKQQQREAEAKRSAVEARVPKLNIEGLNKDQLLKKVKELHALVCRLEEEKYDWEVKIRKNDFEINELNGKVNDIKGKFAKPVLKKVSKTESKFAKIDKAAHKKQVGFRDQLKSTGQSKYALEEADAPSKKPDWSQESLKKKEEGEEEAPKPTQNGEPEAEAEPADEEEEEEADEEEEEEEEEE